MVLVDTTWCSARSEIVVQWLCSICLRIAHCRMSCAFRPIPCYPISRSWPLRPRRHENKQYQFFAGCIADAVRLIGPGNDGLTGVQFMLLAGNVEQPFAAKHVVNLIRFGVRMDALILSGFQAIYIEEAFVGIEDRNFLHLLIRKTYKRTDIARFHDFTGPLAPIVEETV